MSRTNKAAPRDRDLLLWFKRERRVCGPGSNRIRAKTRRLAKATGNRQARR